MGASPANDRFDPGEILAGRYRVVRLLGYGGMAYVYEGEHLRLRRPVAIKVLRRELASAPDIARFEREGRALATMTSRYVTRVLDVDTTSSGSVFLVMELLEGHPLDIELANRGPLPIGDATRFIAQACEGLAEAHGLGIVHRDIKPSNLFLARDAGERIVKVIDFGISKAPNVEDAKLTTTEHMIGTPLYMAPEQFASAGGVDARADVWSLGSTLYELLTGQAPHSGSSATVAYSIATEPPPRLEKLRPDAPLELAAVVARTLERDPGARYGSARELARALTPFATTDRGGSVISFSTGKSGAPPVRADALTQRADAEPSTRAGAPALSQPDVSEASRQAPLPNRMRSVAIAFAIGSVVVVGAAWALVRSAHGAPATAVPVETTPAPSSTPTSTPAPSAAPIATAAATSTASQPPTPASPSSTPRTPPRPAHSHPTAPASAPTGPTHPPIFYPQ